VRTSRAGRLRRRSLAAVVALLAVPLSACGTGAGAGAQVTVLTQNLFLGTSLGDAFAASSSSELATAGSSDWATVLRNDFPTRARVLADEMARARPDVVGLQEVSLWRDQASSDALTHPAPDATSVALDYLAILLGALRARGVPYTTAATSTGADLEYPRRTAGGDLVDLRLTDRDAIIVRSAVADRVSDPRHGHYAAQLSDPFLPGPVRSTRSWESIDYRAAPATTVRIFNTHLEVGDPGTGSVQEDQAHELLRLIAASPFPVIAIGDFNAPAGGSPTYRALTAALHDAWRSARPADPGWTCCQAPSLADPVGRQHTRIDLVLTSESWPVSRVARTTDRPFRAGPPPLWASDHFGVTARIGIPGQ
jgi:endonuclease/exonuclease/phosphatase family metal-dependent hydrolase/predicted small secreted protein